MAETAIKARLCHQCGGWFWPHRDYYYLCMDCRRDQQKSDDTGSEVERLKAEIRKLKETLEFERELHNSTHKSLYFFIGQAEFWEKKAKALEGQLARIPKAEDIPRDMIRRLLHLCHPDKHGNSESSKTATQWLLQQREAGQ